MTRACGPFEEDDDMFPFWDVAIAPVLRAINAKRIVEIGALRGETTVRMLDELGPEAELHVIDPVPEFDPTEHERAFPGRYVFHRAASLDVLGELPVMDAALIDGDHNWYTVRNELQLLADVADKEDAPLPVMIMHDVGWPYGRRDLYYAPERIPEEHRQPYAQRGLRPGRRKVVPNGGLNPTMFNAEVEGGPRNGVMTALEDFISEHHRPVRCLVLPIYFGLAIVVEEERLASAPALAATLDHLESAAGRLQLMELAESTRIQAMVFQHNVFYQREAALERSRRRYLDVVKAALLNEHYLENEVRLDHLTERLRTGRPVNVSQLRDPTRANRHAYERLERQRRGAAGPDDNSAGSFVPYTAMGRGRLDHLERCLDALRVEGIAGDLAECGTGRGGGAMFMRAYLDAHELPERQVWVADRFRATPAPETTIELPEAGTAGFRADLNLVRDGFARFDLLDDRVRFLVGAPEGVLGDAPIEQLALLRIGRGAESDVTSILERLYDRLADGAFVVVEEHADSGTRAAVDAFRAGRGITSQLQLVDGGCVAWRRDVGTEGAPAAARTDAIVTTGPPLAPRAPADVVDLSVVVVFYNMRREAARTLRSLSRTYQEGLDDVSYEVIALDNGSSEEGKLDAALVQSFGPEFRYVEMGADAAPSPVTALNRGIRESRGTNLALMIDGAHVLTPGVLRYGLAGLRTFEPAIVATQQWYVGPGQQGDELDDGYDTEYEDRLFDTIDWPHDGYRLFEISHFIGDRDWFDGMWESNCVFVPRALLEQVGGFDERFTVAGGGYANLELYERLGSAPDISVATIIGEGSFHQLHGGTTTNQADPVERRSRVFGYSQHYAEQRGKPFAGPGKPLHYVGRMPSPSVRRTKSRRRTAAAFPTPRVTGDGPPEQPLPVPEDMRIAFTEAVWHNMPWTRTTWLGRAITTAPTDLLAYQEVIATVRPDWIVETGTGDGGRALFMASICELVDHGRVLSVDGALADDLPQHPRIRYLKAMAHSKAGIERIRAVVEPSPAVLVVLGAGTDLYKTVAQFEGLAPLVSVGSYVIVTDTILNGHPVWPAFGPGPAEAVKKILSQHGEFVPDPQLEKYSLTFNAGGFLERVR
jgi:cephalosporin hydroxylase